MTTPLTTPLIMRGTAARAAYAMAVVLDNIDVVAALDQLQEAFDLAFLDGMNDRRRGQSMPLTLERVPELAMYWRMGARCCGDTDVLLVGLSNGSLIEFVESDHMGRIEGIAA